MTHNIGDLVDITIDRLPTSDGILEDVTITGHVVMIDPAARTTTIAMDGDINGQTTFTVPNNQVSQTP